MVLSGLNAAAQQQAGSIRGIVYDQDFDAPLPDAQVLALETGQKAVTGEQGNYLLGELAPGKYTLVFSKEGFVRQVKADVVVSAGQLTEVDARLAGEFVDMDEFVVRDIVQLDAGTEAALLELRFETPALLDSIGADLMARAGASDAASGLKLIAGASVQDGKFAVIRGLPDRYVSSQMNGVRLPSADEDKRAVELDQFPAAVIESIQVSKTFTPDQQGDASGGAVDVRLRGLPNESVLNFKSQIGYNSSVAGRNDFLTYKGGGVNFLGHDDGGRDVQTGNLGSNWDGAAGVSRGDAPVDYKFGLDAGGKHEFDSGLKLGAFTSLFYERDSSFHDDGVDDSLWVFERGAPLTPQTYDGAPNPDGSGSYNTGLFDVTSGSESVHWGGLTTVGLETENHSLALTYLYTHVAEDTATLAEDTRGKAFFFPGYDPNDPNAPGNLEVNSAPYLRLETLEYTERTTSTFQLHGKHKLGESAYTVGDALTFGAPELDWSAARSYASSDQPDKRQFGSAFLPDSASSGPSLWIPYKPGENFTFGNFQRIYKNIGEDSDQYAANLKWPFRQWGDEEGYVKVGVFLDKVDRKFNQDTFSNFSDVGAQFPGDYDDFWSSFFPNENHPILASEFDIDYVGQQKVSAEYAMLDLPLSSRLSVIGGARLESTDISIANKPEGLAIWFRPGATAPELLQDSDMDGRLDADVDFSQDDFLPALGLQFEATDQVTLRASYAQTVARQTFKELTPIVQQEYLGGPVFVGNPELQMSALENYDLRMDYRPYPGGLVSISWFRKEITDPIEYVQRPVGFTFTTATNYPEGHLSGYEVEFRQDLSRFWDQCDGLTAGANATFIDSQVTLPADEAERFAELEVPMSSRDMTNAPEYLYNLFLTYDLDDGKTQLAAFYTVQGDTLVAGAGESTERFVPSVYAKEYGTLNFSLSRRLGNHFKLQFQAKNLTDPDIQEVYRSDFTGGDVTNTSYSRGREYSLSLSVHL